MNLIERNDGHLVIYGVDPKQYKLLVAYANNNDCIIEVKPRKIANRWMPILDVTLTPVRCHDFTGEKIFIDEDDPL
jgi:hypothetical protein